MATDVSPPRSEQSTFDDASLRAAVAERWGEYGAHIDVFDHMRTMAYMAYELLDLIEYLVVHAAAFPHVNVNEDGAIGVMDDSDGAWCLGCTVQAEAQRYGIEPPRDENGDVDWAAVRKIVDVWQDRP